MAILAQYRLALQQEERSEHTVQKYLRDTKKFLLFLKAYKGQVRITKMDVLAFKEMLVAYHAPTSVNSMLAAVNHFLKWQEQADCRVKPLKIQKEPFARTEKELTEREYHRLLAAAERSGQYKLSLLLQTICATGIRVSELQYITVQAVQQGKTVARCKGKTRMIFLPKELCRRLKQFCATQKITQGAVFCTKGGKPLDRSNIWKMMKRLCAQAKVEVQKVFPHNLRHLFARTYYKAEKDIVRLADLLGHTSVNTTRIYTMESGRVHARQMNRLNLLYRPEPVPPDKIRQTFA